jgi:4-carboxymuconolactone decarboxylase
VSRQQGVTEEKLRALADYERSPVFTAEERAVLRYADAMTDTPVVVSDEVFAAIRASYDDTQIVELTAAIAWENYRARFDHALGVESEGFSKGAYCPMSISTPHTSGG